MPSHDIISIITMLLMTILIFIMDIEMLQIQTKVQHQTSKIVTKIKLFPTI